MFVFCKHDRISSALRHFYSYQFIGKLTRLMCCLMYEHKTYVDARRRFPREGRKVNTALGEERVVAIDIWHDTVTLRGDDGERRTIALEELKQEVGPGEIRRIASRLGYGDTRAAPRDAFGGWLRGCWG